MLTQSAIHTSIAHSRKDSLRDPNLIDNDPRLVMK